MALSLEELADQSGLEIRDFVSSGNDRVRSRPLNVSRWADYAELNACVRQLASEIEGQEGRKRERSNDDAQRFLQAVRILILDLYLAHRADPELQVGIN